MLDSAELNRILNTKFESVTDITFLDDREQRLLIQYLEDILGTLMVRGNNLKAVNMANSLHSYIINYKRNA